MLLAFAIVLFTVSVYMGLDAITVRQKQIAGSLARARRYGGVLVRESELTKDVTNRLLAPRSQRLAALVTALPMTQNPDLIRRRLIAAGLGHRLTPTHFLAIKGGGIVASIFFGIFLASAGLLPVGNGLIFGIVGGALDLPAPRLRRSAAWCAPAARTCSSSCPRCSTCCRLGRGRPRLRRRPRAHHRAHPGPAARGALDRLHEMRIGESRIQALKNFAERLDMPETTSFARSIIQAEQLGMALGRILRVQASDSRQKRQMWAEEKAMKAPIKMLFPTVIFIFPAMFIVILGPAMLQLLSCSRGSRRFWGGRPSGGCDACR